MAVVTERQRMSLRQWAEEHMGEQNAEALMNLLPPKGWDDVATKSDVEGVRTEVNGLRTDVESLRTDVEKMEKSLRADFEKDLKAMGQGLSDRFTAQLATEIREVTKEIAKVHEKMGDVGRTQSWQMVTLIVAVLLAVFGPAVVERVLPPSSPPPAQVVIQSPGE